jgi:hypothetical protein
LVGLFGGREATHAQKLRENGSLVALKWPNHNNQPRVVITVRVGKKDRGGAWGLERVGGRCPIILDVKWSNAKKKKKKHGSVNWLPISK